jgi:hypothetical protein
MKAQQFFHCFTFILLLMSAKILTNIHVVDTVECQLQILLGFGCYSASKIGESPL